MPDNKTTLLVIDNEPSSLNLLKLNCEKAGYHVLTANSGLEGWEMLQKNKNIIQTILLDRMMPDIDDIEFLRKIKATPEIGHIPVIMQTAGAEKKQVLEGIKAGAYYYLTKPYDGSVMLSIVGAAVNDFVQYNTLRHNTKLLTSKRKWHLVKEGRFEIKTLDDATYLATFLSQFFPDPETVVLGISELLVNAIEHGNLGITYHDKTELNKNSNWTQEINKRLQLPENEDKRALVTYTRNDEHITLSIKDQGRGFRWEEYLEISPERITDNHGRGIAMARMMSFNSVEYIGSGNEVVCIVKHNK